MDPFLIAGAAAAVLVRYLDKAAEKAFEEGGKAAWEAATELYHAVKKRLSEASTQQVLTNLKQAPDSPLYADALRDELRRLLASDMEFSREIARLLPRAAGQRVESLPLFSQRMHRVIERVDLTQGILAALESGRRTIALVHLPGVGKTTLASELARSEALCKLFPDGLLWAHVGPDPDERAELRRWALAVGVPESRMMDIDSLADWGQAVQQAIGERRMLLVVDDVWDAKVVQTFLVGGPRCAHLVTTRHRGMAARFAELNFDVRKLSVEQGVALLGDLAPKAVEQDRRAAEDLVRTVDGLPQALVLMGHELRHESQLNQPRRIRNALKSLQDAERLYKPPPEPDGSPAEVAPSLAAVIGMSCKKLSAALRDTLACLSVLRADPSTFSVSLAARVAAVSEDEVYAALSALCDAGLVDVVTAPEPPAGGGEGGEFPEECYTIHRTIADYVRFNELTPERTKALHLNAAAFYREALEELEEAFQSSFRGEPTGYERWYVYEDLAWQDCKDNWLYHLAKADERRQVLIAFLRAWFDGFWWWGCFLEFDFCNQLLREWGQRKLVPRAEHGLQLLRRFMDIYPKETEPDRTSEHWPEIEQLLGAVRSGAGLDGDPALTSDQDERHVRGVTSIFLAEARRFGPRDLAAAEAWYRDALRQFEVNGDRWDQAWTLYHLADTLLERGACAEAASVCEQALLLGEQERDPEVLANLQRVLADVCRRRDDWASAVEHCVQAAREAYRFQVVPKPVLDRYTVRFYRKTVDAVVQRLGEIYFDAQTSAGSFVQAVHAACARIDKPAGSMAEVEAALREGHASGLAQLLLPPAFDEADLVDTLKTGRYVAKVRADLQLSPAAGEGITASLGAARPAR